MVLDPTFRDNPASYDWLIEGDLEGRTRLKASDRPGGAFSGTRRGDM